MPSMNNNINLDELIEKVLAQENINHLINEENSIENVKKQIANTLKAPLRDNNLIGIDIAEVIDILVDYKRVYIGTIQSDMSKSLLDSAIEVMNKSRADKSSCKDVYFNIKGDISLFDADEVVSHLKEELGEDINIVWSATYDDENENQYEMTIIFLEK